MKKVLIITYYWPPSGGSGVQRWLKFVKYLREFGWEPIVYTHSNGEIPVVDHSLEKDIPEGVKVIKQPIWEPYTIYKSLIGQKGEKVNTGFMSEKKKPKFTEKLSIWIRGNFFIPDARMFWIKPSVNFLTSYLRENPVDVIVSTGPPHTTHMIALGLKDKLQIPWLADFRDPWTNIDFYHELMLTSWADKRHRAMEKQVLVKADKILTIGETMKLEFMDLLSSYGKSDLGTKVQVITNGYDTEEALEKSMPNVLDAKFSIAHIGTMVKSRNPEVLWKALSELCEQVSDFKNDLEIKLVGKVDFSVSESIQSYKLTDYVRKIEYMPHNLVGHEQAKSQILLLIVNNTPNAKGILTGKFFEYLAAQRPILCIGPKDGEVAHILKNAGNGVVVDYQEVSLLKETLLAYYKAYKNNSLHVNAKGIEQYSRRNLTQKLSAILHEVALK